jgi:hypothetical protein
MKIVKEPIDDGGRNLRLRGLLYLLVDSIATAAEEKSFALKDGELEKARVQFYHMML